MTIAGAGVPWLMRAQFLVVPRNNFSSSSSCLRIEKLLSLRRLNTEPIVVRVEESCQPVRRELLVVRIGPNCGLFSDLLPLRKWSKLWPT